MLNRGNRLTDIQAQQVEVGRIRLGTTEVKEKRGGGTYNKPVKLERFRLTSRSEQLIREAAQRYGGQVVPWDPQSGGAQQWEVIIEATSLPVIVPPDACSQFYEQWTAGKCSRRCTGARELLSDQPCMCGPDPADKKARGCKPTTRVSLMLADMNGIGVWRLESHGYYAATELPAVVDLLTHTGGHVPARLEMEERTSQIPDPRDSNKTVTSRFMVPVLHVEATPATIIGVLGAGPAALTAAPTRPALEAAPARPADATDGELPDEVKKAQWTAHTWYENKISAETDPAGVRKWADNIRRSTKLLPQWRDNLLSIAAARIDALAPAMAPSTAEDLFGPPPVVDQPVDWEAIGEASGMTAEPIPDGGMAARKALAQAHDPAQVVQSARELVQSVLPQKPPPPPTEVPANADRGQAWQAVVTLAGEKQYPMSKLRAIYGEFDGSGGTITQADAATLLRFCDWMERNSR